MTLFSIGGALVLAAVAIGVVLSVLEVMNDRCPRCKSKRVVNDMDDNRILICLDCNHRWPDG